MSEITQAIAARQTQIIHLQGEIETLRRAASVLGPPATAAATPTPTPKRKAKPAARATPTAAATPKAKAKARCQVSAEAEAEVEGAPVDGGREGGDRQAHEGVLGEAEEGQGVASERRLVVGSHPRCRAAKRGALVRLLVRHHPAPVPRKCPRRDESTRPHSTGAGDVSAPLRSADTYIAYGARWFVPTGRGSACRASTRARGPVRTEAEPSDALPQPGEIDPDAGRPLTARDALYGLR